MNPASPTRRGRPRDEGAEASILKATLEILVEVGFAQLSIEGVSARAGVGKPTVYRRWPNKLDLVVAAVEAHSTPLEAPVTDDPKQDVKAVVGQLITDVTASPLAYAQLALAADPVRHAELIARLSGVVSARQRAVLTALHRAAEHNLIGTGIDETIIVELLLGPPLMHWLRTGTRINDDEADAAFEAVWRAIAV